MENLKTNIEKLGYQGAILNIIAQRDQNREKAETLRTQLREIEEKERNFYLDIDSVFESLKNDLPDTYEEIKVKGRNTHQMKFVANKILYTVEQDLGYKLESVVGCRISIKMEELKQL